ncbi:hypothetical protein F4678DRAFT_422945 [Xylaria arbuscula]|nr:hypothetical protein F4678DRAFT_422945 [Xylaria arbuscula]
MPRPQGEPAGSMKWQRLRYPERPGTFVKLGTILADPYEVEESLTEEDDIIRVPDEDLKDVSMAATLAISTHLSTETKSHLRGLFPVHLVNAGGSIGASSQKAIESIVRASNIQATVFRPSETYMDNVMKKQGVINHLQKSLFGGGRIYIIVGIIKAQRLTIDEDTNRGLQAGVTATAEAPLLGATIDTGLIHTKRSSAAMTYTIDHEVVFAYRVREFRVTRVRKILKDQGYVTDGAMLGTEADQDKGGAVPVMADYDFEFDGFREDEDDANDGSSGYGPPRSNDSNGRDETNLEFWVEGRDTA